MSERYKLVAILWKGRKSRKVAKRSKSRTSKKASPKTWLIWYATLFLFSTCCCFLLYSTGWSNWKVSYQNFLELVSKSNLNLFWKANGWHNPFKYKKWREWLLNTKLHWRLCIYLLYWLLFLVPEHKVSWEAGSESQALSNWRRIFKWTFDTIEWSIFHDHGQ